MVAPAVRYGAALVAGILIFVLIYNFPQGGDKDVARVIQLFGTGGQRQSDGAGYFDDHLHLEARFGQDSWNETPGHAVRIDQPPIVKNSDDRLRGGGREILLQQVNVTIEVRIKRAAEMGGYTALWGIYERSADWNNLRTRGAANLAAYRGGCVFEGVGKQVRQPAEDVLRHTIVRPGGIAFTVELYKDDRRVAALCRPLQAWVAGEWNVQSEIRPTSSAGGAQTPDAGADRFVLPVGIDAVHHGAVLRAFRVTAQTSPEGSFGGASQQIDLEIHQYDETGSMCRASRASDARPGELPRGASHRLEWPLERGTVMVRVGAGTCSQHDSPPAAYANTASVPYRLTIHVEPQAAPQQGSPSAI